MSAVTDRSVATMTVSVCLRVTYVAVSPRVTWVRSQRGWTHKKCWIFSFFFLLFFHSSSSYIYIPTFMWGRCTMRYASSLHVARSYTSSSGSPFSLIPSLTLSMHLLLGLPLFLLPCTFISIALLPTQCSFLLIRCPCHFNLLSWTLFVLFFMKTGFIHILYRRSANISVVKSDLGI